MAHHIPISKQAWCYFYGGWLTFCLVLGLVNATNVVMERLRYWESVVVWDAFVNEYTGVMALFVLIPLVAWFDRRFLFQHQQWKLPLAAHILFSFFFAVMQTALFVAMRKAIYPLFDASYNFGNIAFEMIYEYRKVTIGYLLIVLSLYAFRHYIQLRYLLNLPEALEEKTEPKTMAYLRRLIASRNEREIIINVEEIVFLESAGNYVVIHTEDGQFKLRASLSGIEKQLDPRQFARVHRSYLVNIGKVKEIQPWFRGDQRMILSNGAMINLSRRYRDQFTAQATGNISSAA